MIREIVELSLTLPIDYKILIGINSDNNNASKTNCIQGTYIKYGHLLNM